MLSVYHTQHSHRHWPTAGTCVTSCKLLAGLYHLTYLCSWLDASSMLARSSVDSRIFQPVWWWRGILFWARRDHVSSHAAWQHYNRVTEFESMGAWYWNGSCTCRMWGCEQNSGSWGQGPVGLLWTLKNIWTCRLIFSSSTGTNNIHLHDLLIYKLFNCVVSTDKILQTSTKREDEQWIGVDGEGCCHGLLRGFV